VELAFSIRRAWISLDFGTGVLDLPRLDFAGLGQPVGDGAGFLHGGRDQPRGVVDGGDQVAQGLDGVVDGVGDSARDVLGHAGLHGQIAFGEVAQFVQQPQNGVLIAAVLLLGFLLALLAFEQAPPAFAILQVKQREQQDQGEHAEQIGDLIVERNAEQMKLAAAPCIGFEQPGARLQQGIALAGDALGGILNLHQFRCLLDDARGFGFERLEPLGEIGQLAGAVGQTDTINPQAGVAVPHPSEDPAKQVDVASEPLNGGGGARAALGQHSLQIARDLFAQLQLLGGPVDLLGLDPVAGQTFGDLVGQGVNLSQGTFQQRHEVADRHHGLAPGQNSVDIGPEWLPATFQLVQMGPDHHRRGRQSKRGVAVLLIVQRLLEPVAALLEPGERRFLAARGLKRFRHQRARQKPLLASELEVDFVPFVLPFQNGEKNAHQGDEQHQRAQQRQIGDRKSFQRRMISRVTHFYFSLNLTLTAPARLSDGEIQKNGASWPRSRTSAPPAISGC